jgi:hypothetical protein
MHFLVALPGCPALLATGTHSLWGLAHMNPMQRASMNRNEKLNEPLSTEKLAQASRDCQKRASFAISRESYLVARIKGICPCCDVAYVTCGRIKISQEVDHETVEPDYLSAVFWVS